MVGDVTGETNERETIFVSGSPLETDKLIGVPCVANATGESQQKAVKKLLEEWKIYSRVIGMVFDTTASNTGKWKGAAALLEKDQHKAALLWLSCRHHVYEVHVKHVADLVLGQRNSQTIKLFSQFKEIYPQLDNDPSNYCLLDYSELSYELDEQAESVLKWAKECLRQNTFPREDYRELLELTVIFLGGYVPREFSMRKTGACHHTRFMAYAIYILKIQLLSNCNNIGLTQAEKRAIKRMANFISLCYTKAFLRSRLPTAAPAVDLKFRSLMEVYKKEDKPIANDVIKSINNHLWNLTEELSVLSLFDKNIPLATRNEMAMRLLSFTPPTVFLPGKPQFPKHVLQATGAIDLKLDLVKCVGRRSWLLFHLFEKRRAIGLASRLC